MRSYRSVLSLTVVVLGALVAADASAAERRVFRTRFFSVEITPSQRLERALPVLDKYLAVQPTVAGSTASGPTLVAPTNGLEELPTPPPQGGPALAPPQNRPSIVPPTSRPSIVPPSEQTPPPGKPFVLPTTPARCMTHREFAASFQPAPGNYEVVLLHPCTHRPVKVCFYLPPGCIKKVNVDRNEVEFDYGKFEVELYFKRNGTVEVDIED